MNKKVLSIGLAVVLGAGYSLTVLSQARPEVAVKQRQAVMDLHGKYMYGDLLPMGQEKRPYDANIVARDVGFLDALSKMPWDNFTPATKDVKSNSRPAVFSDTAKFKEAQDLYQGEVAKLVALTKSGGAEAAVKPQILAVNRACNNCHETFREKL
jgi:cytochrome c556